MTPGEPVTLCMPDGYLCLCTITDVEKDKVTVRIEDKQRCTSEPSIDVTLFQCVPKGDKMDLIIQKAAELGVKKLVPTLSARCVSRPDEESADKKVRRFQKISLQAAMQSQRGCIPDVSNYITFERALELAKAYDLSVIFYEVTGQAIRNILSVNTVQPKSICVFIGSEGGFEESEIMKAQDAGIHVATLGKRILRCETAAIAALTLIMYEFEK